MGLLSSILGGPPEARAVDSAQLADLIWGTRAAKSGVVVNVNTALRVSTVFACLRVLGEDVGKVPLGLYQDKDGGKKEKASAHPLHRVLARRPNPWMTSFGFRRVLTTHAALHGDGLAYKNVVRGEVRELLPLMPSSVQIIQKPGWGIKYVVSDAHGLVGEFDPDVILHIRGPSWSGLAGMSVPTQAAEAIGLAIAAEESQARLHSNGARPSGILTTDGKLSKEAVDRLREETRNNYGGGSSFGTMVLDSGLKFQAMGMSGVDAQHLETRKHQVEEICRFFRVHPTKVFAETKTASYASMEQNAISHVQDTLLPWFTEWEQAIDRDLLTEADIKAGYYAHFVQQGLLRGDSTARAAYYKGAINDGWMTRNEVRLLEELDPLDGLDDPLQPLNMTPVGEDPEDDTDPEVDPMADPLDPAAVAGGAAVQDTALNGAQVESLLSIINQVAAGTLPAATARAMLLAAFPSVNEATIDAMLAGLVGFTPEAPDDVGGGADPEPDPMDPGEKAMAAALAQGLTAIGGGLAGKKPPEVVLTRDASGNLIGWKAKE